MADKEDAVKTDEAEEQSPAEKLAAVLGKAEDQGKEGDDEKDEKYDDDFMGKMDRYMKSEAGKKYMCKKAEDASEDETLSKAAEHLQNGLSSKLDDQRRIAADEGYGEDASGYFLHINDSNSLWKAHAELIAGQARLEKAVRELISAQKEDAVLTKATAEALLGDLKVREDLAKAEGLKPLAVKGRQQGADMGPPPTELNANRIEVQPALDALAKAAADETSDLTTDKAAELMAYIKQSRGNLAALPDGIPEEINKYTLIKEVA